MLSSLAQMKVEMEAYRSNESKSKREIDNRSTLLMILMQCIKVSLPQLVFFSTFEEQS